MTRDEIDELVRVSARISLETPTRPDVILTTRGDAIPVCDLDDAVIRAIGKNWTSLLVRKARKQRKERASEDAKT